MPWPRLLFLLLLLAPPLFAADLVVFTSVEGVPFFTQPESLTITVTNRGPDAAASVVVVVNARDEWPVESDDPRCTQTAAGLRCELATLGANETVRIPARHFYRGHRGPAIRITSSVTSATADENPANNEHVLDFLLVDPHGEIVSEVHFSERINDDGTLTIRYDIRNQHEHYPAALLARVAIPRATELIASNADCRATGGPGLNLECALNLRPSMTYPLEVTVRIDEPSGWVATRLTVLWEGYPGPVHSREALQAYPRRFVVTTTADSGPGSLRAVLLEANRRCTDELSCLIDFAIAGPVPSGGWFTIRPLTPLPGITVKRLTIAGGTQTAFSGDTNPLGPELQLDGSALAVGSGLFLRDAGFAAISALAIGNFPENGIFAIASNPNAFSFNFAGNYIGVDPTGRQAMPNTRGIMLSGGFGTIGRNVVSGNVYSGVFAWNMRSLQLFENRIGVAAASDDPIPNGASGIFVGSVTEGHFSNVSLLRNVIANNGHFGVSYPRAVWANVDTNRIANNALGGVDIDLDGPSPDLGPVPRITRAYWDGVATVIEGTTPERVSGPVSESYSVLLFANTQLEPGGYAEGERHFGRAEADAFGRFTLRYSGDLRGLYVNGMTVRRTNFYGEFQQARTSEFGQAVLVTDRP